MSLARGTLHMFRISFGCVRDQPCENSAFAGKRFAYLSPVPRCNVSQNTSEVITLHWRRFRYRNLMGLIALDVLHVTVVVAVRESAYKGEERPRRPWCSAAGSARPRLRLGLASPSAPHRRRGLRPAAPCSGPAAARCSTLFGFGTSVPLLHFD